MTDRRDTIAITATLIADAAWLYPAFGVLGVIFAQEASPLALPLIAAVLFIGFTVGRIFVGLVPDPAKKASFQALVGIVVVYLAMSLAPAIQGVDLLWGAHLFTAFEGNTVVGLVAGTFAAAFLWYRGVQIGSESLPRARLLQTFRIGVLALALSFLAEQAFAVDCHATMMLVPFFVVSLTGLAFARLPHGAAWARTVVAAVLAVMAGGLIIGFLVALAGGRGLALLASAWRFLIDAVGWLLGTLLVPLLEAIFGFIAWLLGDFEQRKSEPLSLNLPEGIWWEQLDAAPAVPYVDLMVHLFKYPLVILLFYFVYRLLLKAYQGYFRSLPAVADADRERIESHRDAKADLISLALGLLPDWMFPRAGIEPPRYPLGIPGISEVYEIYFDMLTRAYREGYTFNPSETPRERLAGIAGFLPGVPAADITECFNRARYGNIAADPDTVSRLRRAFAVNEGA
jgi:hypothetical protein